MTTIDVLILAEADLIYPSNMFLFSEQGTPHSSPHPTNDTKASLDLMSETVSDSTIDRLAVFHVIPIRTRDLYKNDLD